MKFEENLRYIWVKSEKNLIDLRNNRGKYKKILKSIMSKITRKLREYQKN